MRANNEARSIRESVALCLHNMRTDYRILCDDCHDDERRRREECVPRCLGNPRICDDCHDDERRRHEECVPRCLGNPRICDDCHDDERRRREECVSRCLGNPVAVPAERRIRMTEAEQYMQQALDLAKTAMGHTSPNPMVGCVVVKNGKLVASGCHERYGEFHAERNALTRCKEDLTGADLYVTLEPCCHQGKTPPCTDIIIERKIGRVFVGALDPNPKVDGGGIKILREHGIEVITGILEQECLALNEIFFHYITTGLPYVAMKYAMTLDGKIASANGDSKWVTGEKAREHVHFLRKKYSAILAGIDTVLADDPLLNCRTEEGVDPIRVICDSHLRLPMDSQIVKTAGKIRTIAAYTDAEEGTKKKLESTGVELLQISEKNGHVDLEKLIRTLGEKKIDSILVEGGGNIHGSLLQTGLVNRVYAYIAPKLIGGKNALSPVGVDGIEKMKDAVVLQNQEILHLGADYCIRGDVVK